MELKKPTPPVAATKTAFVKGESKALRAPVTKVKEYQDDSDLDTTKRVCLFGGIGTGKTRSALALLELGLKIFYISTDVGSGGIETVEMACINSGQRHLLKNLRSVELVDYESVQQFIDNPEAVYPAIYDFDPDVLFWDGFACYQQVYVSEYVGGLFVAKSENNNKEVSAAVSEGLQMETQHWGQIKNATARAIHNFCGMYNVKTGKKWHKIVTAQEEVKMLDAKARTDGRVPIKEQGYPMLQGKAFNFFNAAFTAIIRTVKQDGKFYYSAGDDNKVAKTREFTLGEENRMEADMKKLWALMSPGEQKEKTDE